MGRRSRATGATPLPGGIAVDDVEAPDPGSPGLGPYDEDDLHPEMTDAVGRLDFGAMLVPVPPAGTVAVEPTTEGRLQAVHVNLAEGRLSVSALAAPKSEKLWPELAGEIDTSLRAAGAIVRSYTGAWGRELHARTDAATSVFLGVDGPRWMLYGVATGRSQHIGMLDAALRQMLRGIVVVRGRSPYPVRTVLPLTLPEHLAAEAERVAAEKAAAKEAKEAKEAAAAAEKAEREAAQARAAEAAEREAAEREAAEREAAARRRMPPVVDDTPTEKWGVVLPAEQYRGRRRAPEPPRTSGRRRAPEPVAELRARLAQTSPAAPAPRAEPATDPVPVVAAAPTPAPPSAPGPTVVDRTRSQPALAYLMADPLTLFAPPRPERRGRHHRDGD